MRIDFALFDLSVFDTLHRNEFSIFSHAVYHIGIAI